LRRYENMKIREEDTLLHSKCGRPSRGTEGDSDDSRG